MADLVSISHAPSVPEDAALVAVGVRADHLDADTTGVDPAFRASLGFEGKVAQTLVAPTEDGLRLFVGLGPAAEIDAAVLRRAGAALAKAARREPVVAATLLDHVAAERPAAAEALAEGVVLGAYRFEDYKAPKEDDGPRLRQMVVAAKGGQRIAAALERGATVAGAVALARDLVNTPGGDLVPEVLAAKAQEAAEAVGLTVEVLDLDAIREERLGGVLGVNRGSTKEPRFVRITHAPERPRGSVALVGKGITFDSGGLSLKTADGMIGMKGDMGGAAAVIGAMTLVPTVAPRLKVTAYLPLTDNMPGPDAMRVGDVLRARNGKTIEVLNTDAEGRLILADALALASEDRPDAIVDLATLTGACMVALGTRTAGLMANHPGWADQVQAAADAAGEPVWPLPLPAHIRRGLDSEVADLKNVGNGRWGGALTAGVFLQEFVADGIPWAHLDIAGPADSSEAFDEVPKGGTGFGVRTLARLLAGFRRP